MEQIDIRNWFKLEMLIHRSSFVMKKLFKHRWKLHSKVDWQDNAAFAKNFAKEWWLAECGKQQQKMINSGDTNNWDITTLGIILKNFAFQNINPKKMKKENANIQKIIEVRNKMAHHASKSIPNDEFEKLWNTVAAALVCLGDTNEELEKLRVSNAEGVEFKIEAVYQDETNIKEANRLKEEGNKEYNSQNYQKAINFYTRALQLGGIIDFDKAILYCNRSVAYMKLFESSNRNENKSVEDLLLQASEDANQACTLRPSWWKAYYRKAETLVAMNKLKEAIDYYESALALDPTNKEVKDAKSSAKHRLGIQEREEHLDPRFMPKTIEEVNNEIDKMTGVSEGTTEKLLQQGDKISLQQKVSALSGQLTRREIECLDLCRKGHLYKHGGENVKVDYSMAASYFSKAASKGGAEGMYNLSGCYMNGLGVKQDVNMAIKLLMEAASQSPMLSNGKIKNLGVGEAQHALGLNYYSGIGVEKDHKVAAKWYEKAVSNGIPNSANNLGLMYMKGEGVKPCSQVFENSCKWARPKRNGNTCSSLSTIWRCSGRLEVD